MRDTAVSVTRAYAAPSCHESRKAPAPSCGLCHVAVAGVGQRGMRVRSGACGNEIMQAMCRHAAARSGTIGKRVTQLACACSKCACTATRRAQRAKGRDAPAALPVSSVLRDVSRTGVHGRGRANCATLLLCWHASPWCSCLAVSARTRHQFLDCGRMCLHWHTPR